MIRLKTNVKIIIAFSKRIILFSVDLVFIAYYSLSNIFTKGVLYENDITFITAAEKNYFTESISLIDSFLKHSNNKLIYFDIGLKAEQKKYLLDNYKKITVRNFEFNAHPKFVSEYIDNKLGSYAWKPIIIDDILNESKSKVVWLDAGNLINKKIIFLKIALTAKNLVVPTSSNTIKDWTHQTTINHIGIDSKNLNKNNYASGLIGFNYKSTIVRKISEEWKTFSSIKECIAPSGSSRINHRQDQAVLTLLLYKHLFNNWTAKLGYLRSNFICGVLFHKKRIFDF